MTLYVMHVEDHEVRLVPLSSIDVLDIPDDEVDEALDLADVGRSDDLAQRYLLSENQSAVLTRAGAILPVQG